jgi:hypothetical protein
MIHDVSVYITEMSIAARQRQDFFITERRASRLTNEYI